jgi:hypothetical protein
MGNCGTREENAVVPAAHAQGNSLASFFLASLWLPSCLRISSRYNMNQCPCCAHRNFSLGGLFFFPWDGISRWVGWLVAESPRYDLCPLLRASSREMGPVFHRFLFRLMGSVLQKKFFGSDPAPYRHHHRALAGLKSHAQIDWFYNPHLLKSHPLLSLFCCYIFGSSCARFFILLSFVSQILLFYCVHGKIERRFPQRGFDFCDLRSTVDFLFRMAKIS